MSNVELAMDILIDLITTVNKVGELIKQAKETGKDIDQRDLQQIVYDRNSVLDQLKAIAYGGK
jgi:hypothetical protein